MSLPTLQILDVKLACATYQTALEEICRLAQRDRPAAVSACNTHLVSEARHDPAFASVLRRFDLVLPDGMPLIWLLNRRGADLPDRVYGPYLMRYVIERTPRPWKHFFFGGSPECLQHLEENCRRMQPDFDLAGTLSPPFREWTEADHEDFARQIRESGADFVWVALGGVRQERWMIEQQARFSRGVFLAVGDAFELLAGHRPFAPEWMQRAGLTWLFRLLQEPRRLWPRYVKYNTLFLIKLLRDAVGLDQAHRGDPHKPRIAFLGARGAPARYAGFETVIDELGARLAARGYDVTVYNRPAYYPDRPRPTEHRGMRLIYLPTIMTRALETIVHTLLAMLHALWRPYDLIYLCGVGNALLALPLRWAGKRVLINVDGIDFKRSKWSGFARWWLQRSEGWALRWSDRLIADNRQVVRHYRQHYGREPVYIAYGANPAPRHEPADALARWDLRPKGYLLYVSRLSPENEALLLLQAYRDAGDLPPLVMVGPTGYEKRYARQLEKLATDRVIFTGPVYGDGYRALSQNCLFFVLPSAIEATRLVLLDQMAFGNAVLFRDAPATREVIGDAGHPFDPRDPVPALRDALLDLASRPDRCAELGQLAHARVTEHYSWDKVASQYEELFRQLAGAEARTAK